MINNLQYIVKNDTRAAMHMAVELCERGDFDSVSEAFRWLSQETVGNYTRYHEMFGTPERAARTMARMCMCAEHCEACPLFDQGLPHCERDVPDIGSIEFWLRGDA